MEPKPILSIVIPTLNRADLLSITLNSLICQLNQASVTAELLVSDNASNDNTPQLFSEIGPYNNISYYRFEDRVDIDASFERSINLANGNFIVLFGDDDIALPGFIYEITHAIKQNPDLGYFYVNRIIGDANLIICNEIPHPVKPYNQVLLSNSQFIKTFTHWPGFVSCLVFSKSVWQNGYHLGNKYLGYNFLSMVYRGSHNRQVAYLASPLVIQRRGIQSWKNVWPIFWLISMPKLLSDLEHDSITYDALKNWQLTEVTLKRFIIDSFVAKAYDYSINNPFWNESRYYQSSKMRKLASLLIQYTIPPFFAKFVYSFSQKMT